MKRLVIPITDGEADMLLDGENNPVTFEWVAWLMKYIKEHHTEVVQG